MSKNRIMRWASLSAALLTLTTLALAQTSPRGWQAWVFSPATGIIQQIDATGAESGSLWLPLAQAFNAYDPHLNISADGRYVAYTAYDSTLENSNRQLFIHDAQADTIRFTHDLSSAEAVGFSAMPAVQAFDSSGGHYAFGFSSAAGWQLVAADLLTGTPRAVLTAADLAAQVEDADPTLLPVVMRYEGAQVVFNLVALDPQATYKGGYRWDIVSGQISEDERYGFFSSAPDLLPATGEIVAVVVDTEREAAAPGQPNAVRVIVPGEGTQIIAHSATEPLTQAYFVRDGAQVLVQAARDGDSLLRVLNRDGSTTDALIGALDALQGTPNGFIGTFDTGNGLALALVDTTSADFSIQTLWSTGDRTARLVHVQAVGSAPGDLPAWSVLE